MSNASKVPAAGHDNPGAATPHGVDLANCFRLDEQQARTWLAATIAACEAWNADPDFDEPDEDAPPHHDHVGSAPGGRGGERVAARTLCRRQRHHRQA